MSAKTRQGVSASLKETGELAELFGCVTRLAVEGKRTSPQVAVLRTCVQRFKENLSGTILLRPVSQAELEAVHSLPLSLFHVSIRTTRTLERDRIETVGQLIARSELELLNLRPMLFGRKSLREVYEMILIPLGLSLRESQ